MAAKPRHNEISLVLIGTKGSGKSSTGNCILGEKKFKVYLGTKSGTDRIQTERKDTDIFIVDTPGVYDIGEFNEHMKKLHFIGNAVFAIVIAIGRYTSVDKCLLLDLEKKYKNILKKSFIIFTRKNELDTFEKKDDRTIHYWLKSIDTLNDFIGRNQIRIFVIENGEMDLTLKAAQGKEVIAICKEIDQATASDARETYKRKISVDYDEMKQVFGEKGAEFFDEKAKYD